MATGRVVLTFLVGALLAPALGMAQPPLSPPAQGQPPAGSVPLAPAPGAAPASDAAPAAPSTDTAAAQARYDALLDRVKKRDPAAVVAELRDAFTETPAYAATMMGSYQALWGPLNKGDFAAALQTAEKVLHGNYVEINAHMVASIAHQQLGNVVPAQYPRKTIGSMSALSGSS